MCRVALGLALRMWGQGDMSWVLGLRAPVLGVLTFAVLGRLLATVMGARRRWEMMVRLGLLMTPWLRLRMC